MAVLKINVNCVSITETREYDKSKAEDFGFPKSTEPKKWWIVKFEVAIGKKKIKPALSYETEVEARRFSEGHSYPVTTWLSLAFA